MVRVPRGDVILGASREGGREGAREVRHQKPWEAGRAIRSRGGLTKRDQGTRYRAAHHPPLTISPWEPPATNGREKWSLFFFSFFEGCVVDFCVFFVVRVIIL